MADSLHYEEKDIILESVPFTDDFYQTEESFEVQLNKFEIKDKNQHLLAKWVTLGLLFTFLAFETYFVFRFAYFQAIGFHVAHYFIFGEMQKITIPFHLEENTFRILFSVTIVQISTMLGLAIKYLFPSSKLKS